MEFLARVFAGLLLTMACAAASAASLAGLDPSLPPDPDDGMTFRVLCLHDVRDGLRASFKDHPDAFAMDTRALVDMFEWLRTQDYHPVSLDQIVAARNGGPRLPPRAILLTFDDGLSSHYTKVFPLLKRFNYPAVFALVTSWIETPAGQRIPISPKESVPRDTFLNWDQVREMAQSNLVEFISHSHALHQGILSNPQGNERPAAATRMYLADAKRYETDAEFQARLMADLALSQQLIQANTGKPVRAIA